MGTAYDTDIIAWANEQAALLRAGSLSALDVEHIAEEIEDVGKSEQRELLSRMTGLLAHLLKWHLQPTHRGTSWEATIRAQRNGIARRIVKTPSLKTSLDDAEWLAEAWDDAVAEAAKETDLELSAFPVACPWTVAEIRDPLFFPSAAGETPRASADRQSR